ncbi:hypothetical protein ACP179_01860 (plasmid) [Xenorhabdus stockiae]
MITFIYKNVVKVVEAALQEQRALLLVKDGRSLDRGQFGYRKLLYVKAIF